VATRKKVPMNSVRYLFTLMRRSSDWESTEVTGENGITQRNEGTKTNGAKCVL